MRWRSTPSAGRSRRPAPPTADRKGALTTKGGFGHRGKMKFLPIVLAVLGILPVSPVRAQVNPIHVRVEQSSKSDTTGYKTVQSRSLNIYIANGSIQPQDVTVKYVIFGRDLKSKDLVTVEQGESKASLKASGTEKVQSVEARVSSEEARAGSKGKSPDTGTRLIGYGVQVLQGEKVVAETYEPASMKASFGKTPVMRPPDKKK